MVLIFDLDHWDSFLRRERHALVDDEENPASITAHLEADARSADVTEALDHREAVRERRRAHGRKRDGAVRGGLEATPEPEPPSRQLALVDVADLEELLPERDLAAGLPRVDSGPRAQRGLRL